jgi:hypothetical protein
VKTCQIFLQWFIALLPLGLLGGFVDAASGQPPSDTAPETAWQSAAIAHAQAMRSFRDSDNGAQPTPSEIPKLVADFDATGLIATYQPSGPTHTANNPFFQVLGTNERTCLTCREPQTGWSVSAQSVQARFHRKRWQRSYLPIGRWRDLPKRRCFYLCREATSLWIAARERIDPYRLAIAFQRGVHRRSSERPLRLHHQSDKPV